MKYVLLAAFAAVSLAGSASSQDKDADQIVIQASIAPSMAEWRQTVGQKLSNAMAFPWTYPALNFPEGTVSVHFTPGADGRPVSAGLVSSSGNGSLDRAALRAVSAIKTLHPLPAHFGNGVPIRANFIFASDEASLRRQQAVLNRREAQLAERERSEGTQVVVLDLTTRTQG